MLPVKSILDVFVDVYLINDLICIVLEGSCENDDLVKFGHQFDEIDTTWSHEEIAIRPILN